MKARLTQHGVCLAAMVCAVAPAGCSSGVEHPSLEAQLASASIERSGHVFLVRGLLGIFSTGMDDLRAMLQERGIAAVAFQHTGNRSAAQLITEHPDLRNSPLIIIGHSLGANAAVDMCDQLARSNIKVDLLITLDPVSPERVPSNVRKAINYYRSDGVLYPLPLFQGFALKRESGSDAMLRNVDLRSLDAVRKGTNHFNIDTSERLQQTIIRQVLDVCPPSISQARTASGETDGRKVQPQEAPTQ